MLYRLSLKNIRKSMKDYAIYFFTLILGVAIFYVFNALESQTVMMNVSSSSADLIDMMMQMLSGVSVFVAFILGFLIIYASRFLMKRRNREFGIYMTLGMGKRKISLILFFETLFIGILSLLIGLGLGVILSQLMSLLVANMFEADLKEFIFVFSGKSFMKTIIYFGIMYLIVMIFNILGVSRCKLIELLNGAKNNEKIKMKNPGLCIIVFIASCLVLARAYYMVTSDYMIFNVERTVIIAIAMGCIATFFIFWSFSGLMLRIAQNAKGSYYKGLNSFTLRQFSSKINTNVFSTTVICLMLFITICLLSSCLTMKNSMNANMKELTPVDYMFAANVNMDKNYDYFKDSGYNDEQIKNSGYTAKERLEILGCDISEVSDEYIEINVYKTEELMLKDSLGSKYKEVQKKFPYIIYESEEPVLKLSDYNKVAGLYGKKQYKLSEDEYMVVADFNSAVESRNIALKNKEKIRLFGHTLKPKYKSCRDGFLKISSQHINTGLVVVPDSVINENYKYQNYVIGNYNTTDKEKIKGIEDKINSIGKSKKTEFYAMPEGITKLSVREAATGLSVLVTFIGLYLGLIFLISSAAILALKELSESSDNRERFIVLRKIGTDEKMINKALFRQIAIFFMLPLVLALVHSVFGIMFAMKVLEYIGNEQLLSSIIMTAIFIVIIYGGYFLITYCSSKNIIKER